MGWICVGRIFQKGIYCEREFFMKGGVLFETRSEIKKNRSFQQKIGNITTQNKQKLFGIGGGCPPPQYLVIYTNV